MRRPLHFVTTFLPVTLATLAPFLLASTHAQDLPAPQDPATLSNPAAPKVDPKAAELFAYGTDRLAYAQNFSFRAKQKINPALTANSGRMGDIEFEVHVSRPDKLRAVATGKVGGVDTERRIQIHPLGSALQDVTLNLIVLLPASESIDEAVDEIRTHFSIPVPLIDFVVNDPYTNFSSRLLEAKYLGTEDVEGTECHHVIFLGTTMDWEVWITTAEILARKFIISVKGVPGKNHIEGEFLDWKFGVEHLDEDFIVQIPEGAQVIGQPPAEFLGTPKIEGEGTAVPTSLDEANASEQQPRAASRTINRPHIFTIPPDTPTATVNGRRAFVVDGTHYLPYLYDGGPVFIAIDPDNPPSS